MIMASRIKNAFLSEAEVLPGLMLANSLKDWPYSEATIPMNWEGSPPTEFGPDNNELHTTALGHSSPCISGKRIFVTTYDKDESAVAGLSESDDRTSAVGKKDHG